MLRIPFDRLPWAVKRSSKGVRISSRLVSIHSRRDWRFVSLGSETVRLTNDGQRGRCKYIAAYGSIVALGWSLAFTRPIAVIRSQIVLSNLAPTRA